MNFRSLIAFSAFLLSLILTTELTAQTPQFDQLKQKFEDGNIFSADFHHELTDSYTGEIISSTGKIWIGSNTYKLESEDQLLVVDGETSKVYDEDRNRLIIDFYYPEDDDFAPSRMLQGVDSTYTVSEEKTSSGALITLESTDEFSVFTLVEIHLNREGNPDKITAYDISENVIITTFSNGSFQKADDDLFELSYPDDAEIVDLRY